MKLEIRVFEAAYMSKFETDSFESSLRRGSNQVQVDDLGSVQLNADVIARMTSKSASLPAEFGNCLLVMEGEKAGAAPVAAEKPALPEGAVPAGSSGDFWQAGKSGWVLHSAEGYERHSRILESVKNVTKAENGGFTLELESKTKLYYDASNTLTKAVYGDGSAAELKWDNGKLVGVTRTDGGKTKTYAVGPDGLSDGSGKADKFGSVELNEYNILIVTCGNKCERILTSGTKHEFDIKRTLSEGGERKTESLTTNDGKVQFQREFDLSGKTMTREKVFLDGVLASDLTLKDGKRVKQMSFDETGKKESQTDFDKDGKTSRYLAFDRTGNVTSRSVYNGDTITRTGYDKNGRPIDELVTKGASLVTLRKFNSEQLVAEERAWDAQGKSSGKKTFEYEKGEKVKEGYFSPETEQLVKEIKFKDGKKQIETLYQTEAQWYALGKKKLETTYGANGVRQREARYTIGGFKEIEVDFDPKDEKGERMLVERRYGPGDKVSEELKFGPDGKTYVWSSKLDAPQAPVPPKPNPAMPKK